MLKYFDWNFIEQFWLKFYCHIWLKCEWKILIGKFCLKFDWKILFEIGLKHFDWIILFEIWLKHFVWNLIEKFWSKFGWIIWVEIWLKIFDRKMLVEKFCLKFYSKNFFEILFSSGLKFGSKIINMVKNDVLVDLVVFWKLLLFPFPNFDTKFLIKLSRNIFIQIGSKTFRLKFAGKFLLKLTRKLFDWNWLENVYWNRLENFSHNFSIEFNGF